MTGLEVKRFELPTLPTPTSGDNPIFLWDTYAEVSAEEITAVVRRFAYWDEKDNKPMEVGFEAYIDGLPDTCGVADVVATHPDVFSDLAAVSANVATLLEECRFLATGGICLFCNDSKEVRLTTGRWNYTAPCPECVGEQEFLAERIDGDHVIIGPAVKWPPQ
ncbi:MULTISPECIES: hypothetical protein [Mycobacterium]|uniref:Uncharacterized protein n=1 Tax=Mycobacterium kiyosense TaxID=2871094 RepID=A0A9P3Q7W2_9MYCO|nr:MULTISPECIES: hypothetical protein [Mycobacterium]BDB45394.1 hypothetical protein IWGMT90018_58400 [Mycobacterium kiyosense]BDE16856.1 hypothetical protein MKCMC460_57160 [Mycobacterium sp. 20KCMC460]GLB83061.1 hypothetical protein SRL2020028_23170 [Mycobacterium kiyosense]GLB90668.1 hypothetical protein SRL2020130_34850 [Mycobacterium kiyosense]GLB97429.1 hypothetical protein SRL2020226_42050 [Mycobacterium kiyosense]